MSQNDRSHDVARLTMLVGPVVPPVLFAIAVLQLLAAIGYGLGLTPSPSVAVAFVLVTCALTTALLAWLIRVAAERKRVEMAGLAQVATATVLSVAVVIVAHLGDMGVTVALPYCMLVAVGGAPFWMRTRPFAIGMAGIFLPPVVLLLAGSPTAQEWSFCFQLSAVTVATSFGLYYLTGKTSKQAFLAGLELEQRATFDGLTGALNRSAWIERAEASLRVAQVMEAPTSCIFLDLDRFKQINDLAGHDAGDEVLGMVGELLRRCAGERDLVGRLGGDEFVVLMPGATWAEAAALAERIHADLRGRESAGRSVSASIGIASRKDSESLVSLVRRADMAMLEAKASGRAAVVTEREGLPRHAPAPVPV